MVRGHSSVREERRALHLVAGELSRALEVASRLGGQCQRARATAGGGERLACQRSDGVSVGSVRVSGYGIEVMAGQDLCDLGRVSPGRAEVVGRGQVARLAMT